MKKEKTRLNGHPCFKTNIGKVRLTNDDQAGAYVNEHGDVLLVVCDGMGGHKKGDYASILAITLLRDAFFDKGKFKGRLSTRQWVYKTIKDINSQIYNESEKNKLYQGMGTTMVFALIANETLYTVNIGDSRIYKKHFDSVEQITVDQTYVDYLYRVGKISKEEENTHKLRHMLTNALGVAVSASYDIRIFDYAKEPILVCSDGLYNLVSEREMFSILDTDDTVEQKVDTLISCANANGGSDNIAISYWECDQ